MNNRLEIELVWNSQLPNSLYDLTRLNNCTNFKEDQTQLQKDNQPPDQSVDIYKCLDLFQETE